MSTINQNIPPPGPENKRPEWTVKKGRLCILQHEHEVVVHEAGKTFLTKDVSFLQQIAKELNKLNSRFEVKGQTLVGKIKIGKETVTVELTKIEKVTSKTIKHLWKRNGAV